MLDYSLNSKQDVLINPWWDAFGGKVIEHNIFGKKYKLKTFNYFDDANAHKRIDDNKLYSENVFGKMDSTLNDDIETSKISVIQTSKIKMIMTQILN